MKIAFFSSHGFERTAFEEANRTGGHVVSFLEARLTEQTAALARGHEAVCAFVGDVLSSGVLRLLKDAGVRAVLLRSAGFNHVDLPAAAELGLVVLRVPAYSPHAIAEHAFALLLALVRRIPRAHARVHDGNFSLDGLVGFDLHGKTFGVVGTGKIGANAARIARGFGCRVLAHDLAQDDALRRELSLEYVGLDRLLAESDVVSLHAPLTATTRHLIDRAALAKMRPGAILVNTSRGGLLDTAALVEALKSGQLGGAALDVYEGEDGIFFRDLSGSVLQDDLLVRLLALPNVVVTAHQAFLTREALGNIAETTLLNATAVERGEPLLNQVGLDAVAPPRP